MLCNMMLSWRLFSYITECFPSQSHITMNLIQVYFSLILLAISAKHYLGGFASRILLNVFIFRSSGDKQRRDRCTAADWRVGRRFGPEY